MRESRRRLRTFCRSIARIVLALASTLVGTAIAVAQSVPNDGPHVTASLISETRNIVAGQPLHLALRQQIQPGWHTYWSNPGESGLPTTIDWSLPQAFKPGPIMWPTPERFVVRPVVGYGYKDEVFLPVTIEVPPGLQPGFEVTLSAHVSWLACSDICIPEDVELVSPLWSGQCWNLTQLGAMPSQLPVAGFQPRIHFPPQPPAPVMSWYFK